VGPIIAITRGVRLGVGAWCRTRTWNSSTPRSYCSSYILLFRLLGAAQMMMPIPIGAPMGFQTCHASLYANQHGFSLGPPAVPHNKQSVRQVVTQQATTTINQSMGGSSTTTDNCPTSRIPTPDHSLSTTGNGSTPTDSNSSNYNDPR
jgi:hypothetical protein